MSNPIVKSTATSTLQSLIKQKIKEKGLSRSEFVANIGYSNISKGCQRLDTFLKTLEAPSEDFIVNITSVLGIDAVVFYRSLTASLDEFNEKAKDNFKPFVEIILGIQIRPSFACQAVKNMCSMSVPSKLQNQPLNDELEAIITTCKNRVVTVLHENLRKHVIGFIYHREHNYYLKFDSDFTLEETVFVQPLPSKKVPLGNRVVDMLLGGIG